jgi:CHASE3 domain sensor protein
MNQIFERDKKKQETGGKEHLIATLSNQFSSRDVQIKEFMENGHIYLDQQKFAEAKGEFGEVLKLKPNSAEAFLGIVLAENKFKNSKEFDGTFDKYYMRSLHDSEALCMFLKYSTLKEREKITKRMLDNEKSEITHAKNVQNEIIENMTLANTVIKDYDYARDTDAFTAYSAVDFDDKTVSNFIKVGGTCVDYVDESLKKVETLKGENLANEIHNKKVYLRDFEVLTVSGVMTIIMFALFALWGFWGAFAYNAPSLSAFGYISLAISLAPIAWKLHRRSETKKFSPEICKLDEQLAKLNSDQNELTALRETISNNIFKLETLNENIDKYRQNISILEQLLTNDASSFTSLLVPNYQVLT